MCAITIVLLLVIAGRATPFSASLTHRFRDFIGVSRESERGKAPQQRHVPRDGRGRADGYVRLDVRHLEKQPTEVEGKEDRLADEFLILAIRLSHQMPTQFRRPQPSHRSQTIALWNALVNGGLQHGIGHETRVVFEDHRFAVASRQFRVLAMILEQPFDRAHRIDAVEAEGHLEGIVLLRRHLDQGLERLFRIVAASPGVHGEAVDADPHGPAYFQVRALLGGQRPAAILSLHQPTLLPDEREVAKTPADGGDRVLALMKHGGAGFKEMQTRDPRPRRIAAHGVGEDLCSAALAGGRAPAAG